MDYNNLTSPNPNYNVDNLDNRSIDMSNNIQPNSLRRDNLSVDYRFGTENFVPEIQRQIIDNYFNGSGSVRNDFRTTFITKPNSDSGDNTA